MTRTLLATTPPAAPRNHPNGTRRLLIAGAVAGPLFVATFLVAGAIRPHYDPLRHPVSSLALGEHGWVQTANFLVAGVLTLALAIGLRRALRTAPGPARGSVWGPLLIGIWAISLLGAGVFTTDPVSGYPPGTPGLLVHYSGVPAFLHDAFSVPGFAAIAAAPVVLAVRFAAHRRPAWAVFSVLAAAAFVTTFVLSTMGFQQHPDLVALGGLFQRTAVTIGWAWLTLLALDTSRGLKR
ncbi:hypothetical protein HNP84_001452 [Thermocatellispora tengchongensis]|uniref:DUF998 domain-containing protein n=1 Tax=Thermocatellispora tengchongensis TaxID=1073253 RepID=A0A840NY86_9ACTN|nr:DUF998 domain-containing protein [Thermocatellispora tengchongensis]MBB5131739.1 hypothetical protein [Thermocatellispora tengchongensis]